MPVTAASIDAVKHTVPAHWVTGVCAHFTAMTWPYVGSHVFDAICRTSAAFIPGNGLPLRSVLYPVTGAADVLGGAAIEDVYGLGGR